MTLADTSIWIDHFRNGNEGLIGLLNRNEVLIHPLIICEIACGHLKNRQIILDSLLRLPKAKIVTHEECLAFIESHRLYGKGVGAIDVQILAASLLSHATLLTLDKKLDRIFRHLMKS